MSNGMRVDLSALDEVIRKLWRLLDDMDKAGTTSKYDTTIPEHAFGQTSGEVVFQEAKNLHGAQNEMKTKIEGIIKTLHGLIDDFSTKTSKVRDKYNDEEHEIKKSVGGDSGGSTKGRLAQTD
ncbi:MULTISPECIES: hypothetical protein [Streptomyces]|uniref:Uncharacterized protein n=1 Tax=Streptomyces osmaniensis TaxID=593134 RepID=A0ABP6YI09_9ACTN|nr:hypothetical protein KJK32_33070 [Streptomyces sp. JCM17656]WTA30536.1 hypothetical protein OIA45_32885 [Streptomyces chartreusis]